MKTDTYKKMGKTNKTCDCDRRGSLKGLDIFSWDYLPPLNTLNFLFLVNCEFPFL